MKKFNALIIFVFLFLVVNNAYAFNMFGSFSNPAPTFQVGTARTGSNFTSMAVFLLTILMGIVGSVALLMMVYGGFVYMTSTDNDQRLSKAKKILSSAIVGFILALMGYVILAFVQRIITS